MQEAANGPMGPTDWNSVNWRKANRQVRNLRRRIFRASQAGDWKTVHRLQKLMLRSYANRLISVRRVTQLNHGRYTPGVDRVVVKTPQARGELVDTLRCYQPWRAHPVRRVYIPKAKGKRRPLGIATIQDRVLQAMVKNALEPSWEARFEGASYGFRPGRGCHDAIAKIYLLACPHRRKKWVVDADIEAAFDTISHQHLVRTLGPTPGRELIKQWLRAGYVDQGVFHSTLAGTGQGAVISPLLLNIAMHGMERSLGIQYDQQGWIRGGRALVRYADDLVVFCETQQDAEAARKTMPEWLAERGLRLSEEKTRIVHLTEGFDFLGFNVRQYPAPTTSRTGYKLLITPSKVSVARMREKLRTEWRAVRGSSVMEVLRRLNPIIRGEANYFRTVVASDTFRQLDAWMFWRGRRYVVRRHPHKSWRWRRARYWGRLHPTRKDHWVFGDKRTGAYLLKFSWFPIERHIMVRGTASPDDPALQDYWVERQKAKVTLLAPAKGRLALRQNGVCPLCGDTLFNGEELQTHHMVPQGKGGTDDEANLLLLHLYCHQQRHAGRRLTHEHR